MEKKIEKNKNKQKKTWQKKKKRTFWREVFTKIDWEFPQIPESQWKNSFILSQTDRQLKNWENSTQILMPRNKAKILSMDWMGKSENKTSFSWSMTKSPQNIIKINIFYKCTLTQEKSLLYFFRTWYMKLKRIGENQLLLAIMESIKIFLHLINTKFFVALFCY